LLPFPQPAVPPPPLPHLSSPFGIFPDSFCSCCLRRLAASSVILGITVNK